MSIEDSTVEYRDVPGFPGYRVGDDGSAWSRRRKSGNGPMHATYKQLSPILDKDGRLRVTLYCEGQPVQFLVHRLILLVFVGPCPYGKEACHFPERSPTNNHLCNLQWGTPLDNSVHMEIHGTRPHGERHHSAKVTEADVRDMRAAYAIGDVLLKELAARYGLCIATVYQIITRRSWRHVD